jgi:hypothetical protein
MEFVGLFHVDMALSLGGKHLKILRGLRPAAGYLVAAGPGPEDCPAGERLGCRHQAERCCPEEALHSQHRVEELADSPH